MSGYCGCVSETNDPSHLINAVRSLRLRSYKEIVDDLEKDPDGEDAQIFYSMIRILRPDWADLTDADIMAKAVARRDMGSC